MATLNDLFELTIPNQNLEGKENFYMSHYDDSHDRKLYKTNENRENGELNLPDERIILSPYGKLNGDQVGYVLIDTREIFPNDSREIFSNCLLVGNDLGSDLNNEMIQQILDFLITSKELVTADKLPKLIEATVTADKLRNLIEATVTADKLRNLIEAVVEIDNNRGENQEKLLPKIVAERDKLIKEDGRSNINYKQLIIYGPAGVGKTYGIRNIANEELKIDEDNFEKQTVHTVFHPEYSYYDFFGKVMPIKDENGQISYDFLPGPFAQALSKAYKNITKQPINPEKVILVVDELNRGNAASIFGGLFNLLDRNNIGISEYPLNIYGMEAMWLKEQIGDSHLSTLEKYSKKTNFEMYDGDNKSLKIYIPDNLSIICTMNTSDQTIFSLDKAFQRRFNKSFKTAQNSIDNYPIKSEDNDIKIKYKDIDIDKYIIWKDFLLNLNEFIVKNAEVEDVDNATIGAFFVKPKGGFILEEDIKYTVMYYLWYDLFSGYRRDTLKEKLGNEFENVNTFEQFVDKDKYDKFITKFTPEEDTTNQDTNE